jgi:hypothetical protein
LSTGGRKVWRAAGVKADCENGQIDVEERFLGGVSHSTGTRCFFLGGEEKSALKIVRRYVAGVFRGW